MNQQRPTDIETLPVSMVFLREHLIITPDGFNIPIRTLTFKELQHLRSLYISPSIFSYQAAKLGSILDLDSLPLSISDVDFISKAIMKISVLTEEFSNSVSIALDILQEKSFSGDDFKCERCQELGLDKQRNCPLLPKETYSKSVFYIIGDRKVNECPMGNVNKTNLLNDIHTVFNIYNNNTLPESGGMVDQTEAFWYLAPYIVGKLKSPMEDLEELL